MKELLEDRRLPAAKPAPKPAPKPALTPSSSSQSEQTCWIGAARCPTREADVRLRAVGLRPTPLHVELAQLVFANGHRHVTAEILQAEAELSDIEVSHAAVASMLQQFADAGLMRRVAINGSRIWFDTNVSDHHHFYVEADERVVDLPDVGL